MNQPVAYQLLLRLVCGLLPKYRRKQVLHW